MPRDTIKVRVNGTIPGYKPGQVVAVETDEHGTPLELQWRRRLRDAKTDNCCEVVAPAKPEPPAPEPDDEPAPRRSRAR